MELLLPLTVFDLNVAAVWVSNHFWYRLNGGGGNSCAAADVLVLCRWLIRW